MISLFLLKVLGSRALRYTQTLPLLIELREYNRWGCSGGKSFPRYLHEAPNWHQLNQQTLKHLLEQPDRVVLLLDGLDEVFDPAEREGVVNDIHRFSNDYKHVRIVVTSRVVGYQPHRLRNAEFRHFMLQDLDEDQRGAFLNRWHDVTFDKPDERQVKRERLTKAIENSKSIAQLAGNPLLLTMMAILNRNQKLPDDRVDLYQQCSRLLLHQWDVERTLGEFPGLSAEIGLREKTDILRTVAYAMQTGVKSREGDSRVAGVERSEPPVGDDAGGSLRSTPATQGKNANYIDAQTLESLIEDYLHTELRFEQSRAVARALVEQLRTRNFILCYLGADSYAFVHRTFLEYFCAADIVHQFNVARTLSEQDLIDLFDAHCRDDDWREVLRLICGQIDEQFVGRIVEHLAVLTPKEQWSTSKPLPEILLAIYCLSEVRGANKVHHSAIKLFDRVLDIYEQHAGNNVLEFQEALPVASREIDGMFPNVYTNVGRVLAAAKTFGGPSHEGGISSMGLGLTSFVANAIGSRLALQRMLGTTHPYIARDSIHTLAEKWPDENTRELLEQRAIEDDEDWVKSEAERLAAELAKKLEDSGR